MAGGLASPGVPVELQDFGQDAEESPGHRGIEVLAILETHDLQRDLESECLLVAPLGDQRVEDVCRPTAHGGSGRCPAPFG